jgi:hypothetical protein
MPGFMLNHGQRFSGGIPTDWTFDEAQSKFDRLIDLSLDNGPQQIQVGDDVVVVLPGKAYRLLSHREPTLIEHLLNGPDLSDLDISRDQSPMREFDGE